MAERTKPIKRSPQLAPLSREHHEGLLAVWKIRQGIAKGIETVRIVAYVYWFWQQHLQAHFEKEETCLPPVLSHAHPFIQQMVEEHAQLKTLLDDIKEHGDLKKLEGFAQSLNNHIRFEERQLFNEVEKTATPEQLNVLSRQLKDEKSNATWDDEFWIAVN